MSLNKFKIIIPSYNNEEWIEHNVASILNQTYTNYEVLYINDASTDTTFQKVNEIKNTYNLNNWTLINNKENKGAQYNYFEHLNNFLTDDEDILVHLDGDDWLYDENVLSKLNNFYSTNKCWMTYGGFVCYGDNKQGSAMGEDVSPKLPYPQSTPYPDFVHKHKLYRKDQWRASHLRTFKSFLIKKVNNKDLRTLSDGKYYWHAADLAHQFPCLEMCPQEKIGVVDFYTHVYNQTPSNQVRTAERESSDNQKYEIEIRNRKRYKEGLTGEKLPQVNVIGDYKERNSIPENFTYVYNQVDGEFDVTLIQDGDIIKYINGEISINRGKVIADIHEAPHLLDQHRVYDAVSKNSNLFDRILTFDEQLLKLPNAMFRNGGGEVVLNKNVHKLEYPNLANDNLFNIYEKTQLVSMITSNKTMTEGHRFRIQCVQYLNSVFGLNNKPDLYGVGFREIPGKIDGLQSYAYSVTMENGCYKNYFTEKILDCFLTGTIPIYWGCPNISEFFNPEGIIVFQNKEELPHILNNLTLEDYNSKKSIIEENYNKALQLRYNNDIYFEKFISDLI